MTLSNQHLTATTKNTRARDTKLHQNFTFPRL